jgi:NitT/TauT family transport system substrate-binding protein
MDNDKGPRPTLLGSIVSVLLIFGLIGLGAWVVMEKQRPAPAAAAAPAATTPAAVAAPAVAELQAEVPLLAPAAAFVPKDNTVDVELSEYAGYAGLIAANGGLGPSEDSVFFKKHGFKVRLKLSEEESWSALNSGQIAASATTVDVLAVYGRQFQVTVPAQIGYSRGADGLVVRSEVRRINDLKGKVIAAAQFTEAEFLIRFLAQEAGLAIHLLPELDSAPRADAVNLVFTDDGFAAGDLFLDDLKSGRGRLAGCVTWEPKTSEVVRDSGNRARILTTNRNLLVIADILIVNKGFAELQPRIVAGLVEGLLEGNRRMRDDPGPYVDAVARAFGWTADQLKAELARVHLSNLPENLAFFAGSIDAAGSFGGIYQSAVLAYGPELIRDPVDSDRFASLAHLKAIEGAGLFKDQKVVIEPIKSGGGAIENDPLLSKDIRFFFEPNSARLDTTNADNLKDLENIRKLLQVSPGSTVLLRGHVDNALVEEFRQQGGEPFVRKMALRALELSKNRAGEIKRLLAERHQIPEVRIDIVGRGWEEPAGPDPELNRRVEVQWFTVE